MILLTTYCPLLTRQGSDPSDDILALAKKRGFKCEYISMGQGQEVHARKYLNEARDNGTWLLLQARLLTVYEYDIVLFSLER